MQRLADARLPVLITGPPGSDKEQVARAIHAWGPRHGQRLGTLSAVAVPEALQGRVTPEIRIGAELHGQHVWMMIADNGCGISPEQQKHLFQPFNTNKPNGNGLGLVITRKLLAMMNSVIEIDSQPQQGTRVTISLPVSPETDVAEARAFASESIERDRL